MNALFQMAVNWALNQLLGSMAGEAQRILGMTAGDFSQLVRADPRAAVQKLAPLMEQFRQSNPAEMAQVETLYRQYAGGGNVQGPANNKQ